MHPCHHSLTEQETHAQVSESGANSLPPQLFIGCDQSLCVFYTNRFC
jgi:hypothetical protein